MVSCERMQVDARMETFCEVDMARALLQRMYPASLLSGTQDLQLLLNRQRAIDNNIDRLITRIQLLTRPTTFFRYHVGFGLLRQPDHSAQSLEPTHERSIAQREGILWPIALFPKPQILCTNGYDRVLRRELTQLLQWDHCLSTLLIRSTLGASFGVIFSVLLFKRRAWPVWAGLGFGAGRAWEECDSVRANICILVLVQDYPSYRKPSCDRLRVPSGFPRTHNITCKTDNLCRASSERPHHRETGYGCCDHEKGQGSEQGQTLLRNSHGSARYLRKQGTLRTYPKPPMGRSLKIGRKDLFAASSGTQCI